MQLQYTGHFYLGYNIYSNGKVWADPKEGLSRDLRPSSRPKASWKVYGYPEGNLLKGRNTKKSEQNVVKDDLPGHRLVKW